VPYQRQGQTLDDFPQVRRWFESIRERPATLRAYALAETVNSGATVTDQAKTILFGQSAATVRNLPK